MPGGTDGATSQKSVASHNDASTVALNRDRRQEKFDSPDGELDRQREENARRDRLTAGLRELCRLARRAVVEFILDFAAHTGAIELLEQRTAEHNPDLIARCSLSRVAIDSRHRVCTLSGANSDARPVEQPRLLPHHEGEHDARLRQVPPEAQAALADAVDNWVPQPILTSFRRGYPGYRDGAEIAWTITRWNAEEIAKREEERSRGVGPYQGFQSAKPLESATRRRRL